MVVSASSKHGEQQPSPRPGASSPFCAFHETLPESAPYLGDMGVPGLERQMAAVRERIARWSAAAGLGRRRAWRECARDGGDDGGVSSEGVTPRGDGSDQALGKRASPRCDEMLAKTSPTNARTSC